MTTKICVRCNLEKDLLMFHLRDINKNRRQSRCRICVAEVAKEQGYSIHSQKKKEQRLNRTKAGNCMFCKSKVILDKKVCRKHYVVNVAKNRLGIASSCIIVKLLEKFDLNPYCPYTGEALILGQNTHLDHILSLRNHPELKDDIDNVEWVSETANLSKNGFNKDEFILFCKIVSSRF